MALLDTDSLQALAGNSSQHQHGDQNQEDTAHAFSVASMKRWVERLVGRSAIRVPAEGMDKLFDMIWMVTKYQLANVTYGHEWLALIDNHLDNVCGAGRWWGGGDCGIDDKTRARLDERRRSVNCAILAAYRDMSAWEMQQCKYAAWNYMLQKQVRVSLLVQGDHQEQGSGQLWFTFKQHQLPPGFQSPGVIQYVVVTYNAVDFLADGFDSPGTW